MDISTTLQYIKHAHRGQYYGDVPYFHHPFDVMKRVRSSDEHVLNAALLHDVLEDTNTTKIDLKNIGFSDIVIDMVELLTRQQSETYQQFIDRVCNSGNQGAILIKIADIESNMSKGPGPKESLRKRYIKAHRQLLGASKTKKIHG